MVDKVYSGFRVNPNEGTVSEVDVFVSTDQGVRELSLEPSLRVYNHSPTGFNWGYAGSGPAQLALAILMDHFSGVDQAVVYYQRFKSLAVSRWGDEWKITSSQIQLMVAMFKEQDSKLGTHR